MEQKNPNKFRLHLNLFDCVVIFLALAVGGVLLWNRMKPQETAVAAPAASSIQYTIRLQKVLEGTGALVKPGDELVDAVKNFDLGKVAEVSVEPASRSIVNEENQTYVTAQIPGYEDIYITIQTAATRSSENILLGSGYEIRVAEQIYVRGPGYLGSGDVYAIERGK